MIPIVCGFNMIICDDEKQQLLSFCFPFTKRKAGHRKTELLALCQISTPSLVQLHGASG